MCRHCWLSAHFWLTAHSRAVQTHNTCSATALTGFKVPNSCSHHTCLSQAALAVAVAPHLPVGHSIDPVPAQEETTESKQRQTKKCLQDNRRSCSGICPPKKADVGFVKEEQGKEAAFFPQKLLRLRPLLHLD